MSERLAVPSSFEAYAVSWPEVEPGADLAELLLETCRLQDGDIVVLTSKVVSKAERRQGSGDRNDAIAAETVRVVARKGETAVVRTRHGLVIAAAGVDSSNTLTGTHLLLPDDPDESARRLRDQLRVGGGPNVAVVVSDTAGRAWRLGQTDHAIGCAGILPLVDLAGARDYHGNELQVTSPALADELAGAGELVKGKTTGRPVAVVRGFADWVLPAGDHGPGAAALVRAGHEDLFGLGAREAVLTAALARGHDSATLFSVSDSTAVAAVLDDLTGSFEHESLRATWSTAAEAATSSRSEWVRLVVAVQQEAGNEAWMEAGRLVERAHTVLHAHRYVPGPAPGRRTRAARGWQVVAEHTWLST